MINAGGVWLRFREEERPFGIALKEKRSHYKISLGDLIQVSGDMYMVDKVGVRKVNVFD